MARSSIKKIGLLTSGGDSPGMNAAIRAVVRSANYYNISVCGVMYGYQGLIDDHTKEMNKQSVANILQRGGTILKTARSDEFREKKGREQAFATITKHNIDALIIVGGDGSLMGAHVFSQEFGVACVGLPGTIDNDLVGTDYTIGFDTATNTAIDAIDKIRDTADALDRIFVIEVMGKNCGYIAMYSGLTTGAEHIFVPEQHIHVDTITEKFRQYNNIRKKSVHLIVVAEGFHLSADKITTLIKKQLPQYDVRMCILGHIQRGGTPTYFDRLLASRLGFGAVECLREKKHGIMVGIVNNQLHNTPLNEIVARQHFTSQDFFDMVPVLSS